MSAEDLVKQYLQNQYRIVVWPQIGDVKGPKEKGWTDKIYSFDDYNTGNRVGLLTGTEIEPGKFLHDVDIDWAPGAFIAQRLLPPTDFVFGRPSKRMSHCMYTLPTPEPSYRYEDVDHCCLLEFRGTKSNGELGMMTMVPPSIWSKEGISEPLSFLKTGALLHRPSFIEFSKIKQSCSLSAIGSILARNLGQYGFGHDARLAWSGFLLRLGIPAEDLVAMGEGISIVCQNEEVEDVKLVVESTAARLSMKDIPKIKGGPALAKILNDNGKPGKLIIARIIEWLGLDSDFIRNADGIIVKDSQENIKRSFAMFDVELSYDEFSDKMFLNGLKALEDREVNNLWLRIDSEHKYRPSFVFFEKVVKECAWTNSHHPVREYIEGLVWDGTPRIDFWIRDYGGAIDSDYLRAVSSLVLIAGIKRIRHPGCKFDEMLVLESGQGLSKSTALRSLCPKDEWFSDDLPLNVDSKGIIEATLGKWIIEASDLAGKKKTDVEHLKASLSRQVDGPARMAYAHFPVERRRMFILIGTTNSSSYLSDSTNRRFWPVKIRRMDIQGIIRDRDQLWAEAAHRESLGEDVRLPEHLWKDAEVQQEARREIDAWEMFIEDLLADRNPDPDGIIRVSNNVLWECLSIEPARRDRLAGIRMSEVMDKLGYHRTTVREGKKIVRGYMKQIVLKLELKEEEKA